MRYMLSWPFDRNYSSNLLKIICLRHRSTDNFQLSPQYNFIYSVRRSPNFRFHFTKKTYYIRAVQIRIVTNAFNGQAKHLPMGTEVGEVCKYLWLMSPVVATPKFPWVNPGCLTYRVEMDKIRVQRCAWSNEQLCIYTLTHIYIFICIDLLTLVHVLVASGIVQISLYGPQLGTRPPWGTVSARGLMTF